MVCDAVLEAWNGSGGTITDIAERFGVSSGWVWKWVYPELRSETPEMTGSNNQGSSSAPKSPVAYQVNDGNNGRVNSGTFRMAYIRRDEPRG